MMATDHRHALAQFLRTDRHRLEAALDDVAWSSDLARRFGDHLRLIWQMQAVYVEGQHPQADVVQAVLAALTPQSGAEALQFLVERHDELQRAISAMPDARFDALVIDPLDRNLTVLGHLYDLTRSSAALVAWAQMQAHDNGADPLAAWWETLER